MDTRYSGLSKVNHWLSVIFVVVMLTLGYLMFFSTDDGISDYVKAAHISVGFFAFFFLLWRVLFRLQQGFPAYLGAGIHYRFARAVHYLILASILVLIFTGPLYLFTENAALSVFNWFSVSIDLSALEIIHEPAEQVHKFFGRYLLPALLVLHILGGIGHFLSKK